MAVKKLLQLHFMKKIRIDHHLILLNIFLLCTLQTSGFFLLQSTSAAEQSSALVASGDTVIDPNNATTTLNENRLEVAYSNFPTFSPSVRTLLQFNLATLATPLSSAAVVLHTVENNIPVGGNVELSLYTMSDNWEEGNVTYETAPTPGNHLQTVTIAGQAIGEVRFANSAITDFIEAERVGDQTASFFIELSSGSGTIDFGGNLLFENREGITNGVNGDEPLIDYVISGAIKPIAPSALAATGISETQVDLSWSDNSDNESGFQIIRSPTSTTNWSTIATLGANVTTYTNTDASLICEEPYRYRVRAYNSAGNSLYSTTATAQLVCPNIPPVAPSGMNAQGISLTQISLGWVDNSNNETSFQIIRSPTSTTGWINIATPSANVTTYIDTDPSLSCGEGYRYRLRAHNDAGNSLYTNTATAQLLCTTGPIFADGFEGCSLSSWTAIRNVGSMSATAGAALVGNCGLQMAIDNNTATYLTDDSPYAEVRYRMRFYLDPNSLVMAQKNMFLLFYGHQGTSPAVLRVDLRRYNDNYQLRSGLLLDSTTWKLTPYYTISDAPHSIEIEWQAATAVGANNGSLGFWIDGVLKRTLTGIDNDTRRIDRGRLGAFSVDTGTRGTFYIDEFVSVRDTYVGPVGAATTTAKEDMTEARSTIRTVITATLATTGSTNLSADLDGPVATVTTAADSTTTGDVLRLTTLDDDTLPYNYARIGDAIDVEFISSHSNRQAEIVRTYTVSIVDDMLDSTISLQTWNASLDSWEIIPTTLDVETHTLRAILQQSARLAVMQPESFEEYQLHLPIIFR